MKSIFKMRNNIIRQKQIYEKRFLNLKIIQYNITFEQLITLKFLSFYKISDILYLIF